MLTKELLNNSTSAGKCTYMYITRKRHGNDQKVSTVRKTFRETIFAFCKKNCKKAKTKAGNEITLAYS